MKMKNAWFAAPSALLIAVASCSGGDSGTEPNPPGQGAPADTVRMVGNSFVPATLTIRPGRTVVWVNTQPIFHTVTPDGNSVITRATTAAPGEAVRVTFNAAGTYDYFCEPHVSDRMTGRIVVQ